jgi:hypothetical protein
MVHVTRTGIEGVSEMFSERARDVTPAAARDADCVWYAPLFPDAEAATGCASLLSANARSNRCS